MERQYQKWVNLSYLAAAILFGYIVFSMSGKLVGIYDLETRFRNIDLILRGASVAAAAILFVVLYRKEASNQFMNEAVAELFKVTWPTPKETSSATMVVIVMVLISGVVLGLLDYLWVQVVKWIL
jgi:preprotein translocase subunit SecE